MSSRSLTRVALAAAFIALLPRFAKAQAQAPDQTVCKDGTVSKIKEASTCDGHGGVDDLKTAMLRRKRILMGEPKQPASDAPVTQAGTPSDVAPRTAEGAKPRLPSSVPSEAPARERSRARSHAPSADWRYDHHRPKNAVARCRDGTYVHGKGNRKNACKHHGGIARWYGR